MYQGIRKIRFCIICLIIFGLCNVTTLKHLNRIIIALETFSYSRETLSSVTLTWEISNFILKYVYCRKEQETHILFKKIYILNKITPADRHNNCNRITLPKGSKTKTCPGSS